MTEKMIAAIATLNNIKNAIYMADDLDGMNDFILAVEDVLTCARHAQQLLEGDRWIDE